MSPIRSSGAATKAQTRAYRERADVLVAQLRDEIGAPAVPAATAALVVLMGYPGVGKSHCARLLAARLGAAQVASDQLRTRLFIAPTYSEEENGAVFRCVDGLVDGLLADGHRVIVDATNLLARYRGASVGAAKRHHVPVVFVRITADDRAIRDRLARRRDARAHDDHSDADEGVYDRMRERPFEPPAEGYLELANGPDLVAEIDRVAAEVERVCASAI
ncbi:MAG TPA: ATP-binding protein [Candidatus Saccharimonadales bacterium]|nr:ATP-binding protein [Candidatus Saccharimonadales bacterium]